MPNDLWNYALRLYGQPGAESACLALQDAGADVCLLLCGCWLQARDVTPNESRTEALHAVSAPWQQAVIEPLRALRQGWKTQAGNDPQLASLRGHIKGLELGAEQVVLERLQACAGAWPSARAAEEDWLTWLAPQAARDSAALATLRGAARGLQASED